jgi:dienelactone hydrolase
MTERAVQFGPEGALAGVLCEPDGPRVAGAPAVLLWNVGVNHHVGPYRIYVDLARCLARQGFTSLRFDASGLGDSEPRKDSSTERERAALDLQDAMALVERRTGISRFVLVGFCSSVDAAHQVAAVEPRAAGAIFIEGYAWRTAGFYRRYWRRYAERARWDRLLRRHLPRWFPTPGGALREVREEVFVRDYPTHDRFRRDVHAMVERGARLLFVYVGGDTDYNGRDQLFEMLGGDDLRERVDVEFFPGADHTFFRVADRLAAVERIARFMNDAFPAAKASAAG